MWWYLVLYIGVPYTNVAPTQIIIPKPYGYEQACEKVGREVERRDKRYSHVCVPWSPQEELPLP